MHILEHSQFSYPFIVDGIVKDTNDPQQMGRCKIWIPAIDGEFFEVDRLPWAEYASPFAGSTLDFKAGRNNDDVSGYSSYGLWAIPKIGATVLVMFLYGDTNRRVYFGGMFGLHKNRSLPAGRNKDDNGTTGPWTDSYEKNSPEYANLREQFQNDLSSTQAQTRGAYERQVAQAKTTKDGTEGYSKNIVDASVLDPQVYCLVTPGHHALIMTDDPTHCRVRLKTTAGNQIIFDDTNERIYISTARGGTYVELDENGKVHIFAADSFSVRTGGDFNVTADKNINLAAGGNVNVKASGGNINLSSSKDINISSGGAIYQSCCDVFDVNSSGSVHITSEKENHFKSSATTFISSSALHMNGPAAAPASCASTATDPSTVPGHEPWSRPNDSKVPRNPNWRP